MTLIAGLVFLALVVILPGALGAQGFRAPAAGRADSGGVAGQSLQSTPGSVTTTATPAPAAKSQVHRTPVAVTPRVAVPVAPGAVFAAPSGVVRHPTVPHFHHHPHPAIVIIDAPYYWPYTVVTQSAPGVLIQERRYPDTPPAESRSRGPGQLAPFDPTPQEVVERMLRLAALKPGDLLYDLGAGDGRVVIAAAKQFGIRAVGFEIDPGLVKLARENARKQGVDHLVEIRQQDFLTADLSVPSVVTLYLSYDGNLTVRPRLMSQLRTGARVVSYTFDMAEWQPKITESYRDRTGNGHMIYLWEVGGGLAFSDGGR